MNIKKKSFRTILDNLNLAIICPSNLRFVLSTIVHLINTTKYTFLSNKQYVHLANILKTYDWIYVIKYSGDYIL